MTTIANQPNPALAGDLTDTDRMAIHRTGQTTGQPIAISELATFFAIPPPASGETFAGGLSGNGTTQGSATVLAANKNIATTVTTPNNAFKLPAGTDPLVTITLFNDGAENAQIFPATGEDIGAGVNAAVSIAAGDWAMFEKKSATTWFLTNGTVYI